MLDCTEAGDRAGAAALPMLAAHTLVRLAWSCKMHGGGFQGRSVDAVKAQEWQKIATGLKSVT